MKGFAKMARHKGPFAAIRQMQRSSPEAITVTRERLTTRCTRLYLGTASDEDFSVVATYLLYGYVLAENFEAVEQDSFAEAIRELRGSSSKPRFNFGSPGLLTVTQDK